MKHFPESIRLASPVWAALLCLAIIPAAHATLPSAKKEKELVGSVRVAYADLDLTRRADVQTLLGRDIQLQPDDGTFGAHDISRPANAPGSSLYDLVQPNGVRRYRGSRSPLLRRSRGAP